jgi:hypothetical protein
MAVRFWYRNCVDAGRLQNSGMLINRVSGDAGSFADKLGDERFAVPFVGAQQRCKPSKYELHRWNIAQHCGQFRRNCEVF